jgi:hypothetical protein
MTSDPDRIDPSKLDPESKLTRKQLAAALTAAGYPTSSATLQTLASRGGGCPYEIYGRSALYTWGVALAWAQTRCKPRGCSTSEYELLTQQRRARQHNLLVERRALGRRAGLNPQPSE